MLKKKVCMLGAFAVGKTSLVRRYVHSLFSEKYHTTVGVKVDKKTVACNDSTVDLILWDIHGEDDFQAVRASYLRGASGCLLVVDGTRGYTLTVAHDLVTRCRKTIGNVPVIFVFNKSDLMDRWEISASQQSALEGEGAVVVQTSAKDGSGVESAFTRLVEMMLME
ncbi:small GTP-binding protein [Desulfosarcina variabilis str. Montpellier]|uniref:Rab family GTPase n=1 Tax=Desulfosarcina variabilis TaxID=2300 RepID=UPI003AFA698E